MDFVLEPFPKRMEVEVAIFVDDAADAVTSLVLDGLQATQIASTRGPARLIDGTRPTRVLTSPDG